MTRCVERPRYRCALAIAILTTAAAHAHDEPIVIGRTADPARLAFERNHEAGCVELQPGDGLFQGLWVHDEPSFVTLMENDPGFLRLLPGHSVALRLIEADPALRFFEPIAFSRILANSGAEFVFPRDAEGDFDIHLLGAAAKPGRFAATFQFTDSSGLHLDSDPFTMCFQTVPAPASALVLVALATPGARRRRRSSRK